jgi:acetylornithine/N-succinyldiaminopimelate aminotransferase
VIRLLPSLTITRKQIDEFLDVLQEEINALNSVNKVEVTNESKA